MSIGPIGVHWAVLASLVASLVGYWDAEGPVGSPVTDRVPIGSSETDSILYLQFLQSKC
jgi:hypothetical protein